MPTNNPITYKTVIANAIKGFNDIQDKLNNISAQYGSPLTNVPQATTISPLSVEQMLTSDAFRTAELDLSIDTTSMVTSLKHTSANIILSQSGDFALTVGKDAVTTAGTISPTIEVTRSGYIKNDIEDDDIEFSDLTVTEKTFYIQSGTLQVQDGTPINAIAYAGLSTVDSTHLAKLTTIAQSGVSTSTPSGNAGGDYWKIIPMVTSSVSGTVSPAHAKPDVEGYIKENVTADGEGSEVVVPVTGQTEASYYIKRLSSGTLTVTDTPTTTVTVGTLNGLYYPISTSITATWSASSGGYLPVNGNVSGTDLSAIVGRIPAASIVSSVGSTTARGFISSSTATEWYVTITPAVQVTNAGYTPATGLVNGSNSTVYLPGATLVDGFVTSAGMVKVNDEYYITRYNTTDECVEILFKDDTGTSGNDVSAILAESF